jgi:sigma-B regulation protein RsbU (phosphoserine phosphatase)
MANVVAVRLEQERMALIAEQERFHAMEIEQAAEIQRNHLPAGPPCVAGFEIAGHQSPSRTVGGDYYDFLSLPNGRTGLVVADVAGKGLPASLLMMKMQAHVQALGEMDLDPAEFVKRFNRSIAATCPANRFITFCIVEVDAVNREVLYCNAGHNPPFILHAAGGATNLTEGGPVVGLLPKIGYRSGRLPLAAGDVLAMYSDGITEAENDAGEEFGEGRLRQVLERARHAPAAEIIREISAAVEDWTGGAPPSDDRTLLLMKVLD